MSKTLGMKMTQMKNHNMYLGIKQGTQAYNAHVRAWSLWDQGQETNMNDHAQKVIEWPLTKQNNQATKELSYEIRVRRPPTRAWDLILPN